MPPSNLLFALFSGSGIGLLIGVLMGTTVTATVGVIIGALASGLAVLLGLNDQHFSNTKAIRIGSFGFACVFGAYLGIYARAHDVLSPQPEAPSSLAQQKAEYLALGFNEKEVLDFIAFSQFGIRNPDWVLASESLVAASGGAAEVELLKQKSGMTLLFGAEVNLGKCAELAGPRADFELIDVVEVFDIAGGVWRTLAFSVQEKIGDPNGVPLLLATRDAFCDNDDQGIAKISDQDCKQLSVVGNDYRVQMRQFESLGGVWQELADGVQGLDMDNNDKVQALELLRYDLCKPDK
jgi:hypothetical protein